MAARDDNIGDYILHATSGIQAIVIVAANGLLLFTILLHNSFRERKEMVIIAGMACADVIYGLGVLLFACYRFYILLNGLQNVSSTAWECIILPPTFITNIGNQLTSIMNAVLSADRLLAVAWPTKYYKLDSRYAHKVLAFVGLFGVTSLIAMILSTYFDPDNVPKENKMCSIPPLSSTYNLYHATLNAGAGCLSVAIYIWVFVAYRRGIHQVATTSLTHEQRMIDQQRHLTVTLGIITISTLIFYIIPFMIIAIYAWMNVVPFSNAFLFTCSRVSTILNVLIYVARQKEMSRAMWALVRCKKTNSTVPRAFSMQHQSSVMPA